jgi:hypothetical protein
MAISADWVSAIIAALSLGYLIGSGVQRRRDATRNAMPIIRASWSFGSAGVTVKVKLVNRLNEDLYVTKAECRTNFSETIDTRYDPATGKAEFTYEKKPSPMPLRWTVPAAKEDERSFSIDGAETARWIRLTLSSSAGTLRKRRIIVREHA